MILPRIRASFDRQDALHLVRLVGRDDPSLAEAAEDRLQEEGMDALLDDPRVLNALLTDEEVSAPPALVFYVIVRHALLEGGINDRDTADYVASVVCSFGEKGRAYRISDGNQEEYHYLVDMVAELREAEERRSFLLRTHLGNYSLWLSGLFPDFVEARVRRRGAPPIGYYEQMGVTGFRTAARTSQARNLGMEELFDFLARHFTGVRVALNRVSDRYLWPEGGDPVNRLLREISERVDPG